MAKLKCTGRNCPQQAGTTDPAKCPEPEKCRFATFPQTNGDRIREMTDEELAKLLKSGTFICGRLKNVCKDMPGCEECCLVWLRSPVEESHE